MNFSGRFFLALLLSLPVAILAADDPQPTSSSQTEDADAAVEETVTVEDVWSKDPNQDDEVFVPSETVSADASIAFPADI